MRWLIAHDTHQKIMQAIKAGIKIDANQQAEFMASATAQSDGSGSRLLSVAGDVAQITVKGILTDTPDFFASIFGGGNITYGEIITALASADADPDVSRAILKIDSPGGTIDGLFDTLAAIQAFSKPIGAVVANKAESAAFAIAAQADTIAAANPMTRFGSIGVAAEIFVSDDVVNIASKDAPKKRPNVTTAEGFAIVQEELDALHEVFAEAIASGRTTTVETVNTKFGQGATLVASDALKRGMIDSIQKTSLKSVPSATATATATTITPKATDMNLAELQTQHPDVYAQAVALGVTDERERVSAHLIWGEAADAMKIAVAAVKDGTGMTASMTATYSAAALNNANMGARGGDEAAAAAAADGAAASSEEDLDAHAETVLKQIEDGVGITSTA